MNAWTYTNHGRPILNTGSRTGLHINHLYRRTLFVHSCRRLRKRGVMRRVFKGINLLGFLTFPGKKNNLMMDSLHQCLSLFPGVLSSLPKKEGNGCDSIWKKASTHSSENIYLPSRPQCNNQGFDSRGLSSLQGFDNHSEDPSNGIKEGLFLPAAKTTLGKLSSSRTSPLRRCGVSNHLNQ